MCRLSIILPSLNVVNYIEESIKSVLAQTMKDIEIICVDAGSDDGTIDILKSYAALDNRIKIIDSDKKSYGYQMNLGIKAAKGDYIGIVETDDYVVSDMFSYLHQVAADSNADFVKSGFVKFFDYDGRRIYSDVSATKLRKVWNKKIDLNICPEYRVIDINHIWSGIYRREFLIQNDLWFNETPGASFQDTSFSTLVGLVANTCVYLEECFYHYRTDRQESSVKSDKKYKCIVDELNYIDAYLQRHSLYNLENKRLVKDIKLRTYRWNLLRLTDESKQLFMKAIEKEMQPFLQGGEFYPELTAHQHETVQLLTDFEFIKTFQEKEKKAKDDVLKIIAHGIEEDGYIFVGTGQYFEQIIVLQKLYEEKIIYAVCDNDKGIQGTEKYGYIILSVEDAAEKYKSRKWLIANKYYADDIKKQLLQLGIEEDKLLQLDYFPNMSDFPTV